METSSEWVDAVIQRLHTGLPHRNSTLWSPVMAELLVKTQECVVGLSLQQFSAVLTGLGCLLQDIIRDFAPAVAKGKEVESYCALLDCITSCLAKRADNVLDDEDLHSLQHLYQRITKLCLLSGEQVERITISARSVLYQLSGLHFHGIFNKIILRVTSVNRGGEVSTQDNPCVIQLIPHLNLNAGRLQQILQVIVTSFKDLKKHKQLFLTLPPILHRSIWNFISEYPHQYNDLLKGETPSLARSAEKLFGLCDDFADNQRRKSQVWPLQNTLVILCPHILKDIAENGLDKSSPKHRAQRGFINAVMKGLTSSNKQICEAATVCGVDLFKGCAYVGEHSSPIFRYLTTSIQTQLQHLLFNPQALFLHQPSSVIQAAGIPTFNDLDLMITFLVAQFRCNHRNSHIFKLCLEPTSPAVFRVAFVAGLYAVLKEPRLPWWPSAEVIYQYAPQLRQIFQNVLSALRRHDTSGSHLPTEVRSYLSNPNSAAQMLTAKGKTERKTLVEMVVSYQLMQGLIRLFGQDPMLAFGNPTETDCIMEFLQLMTGLVGLVQHQSVPYVSLNASQVLLTLHEPDNIMLWDKKDFMTAFWDISGQVTYSIALKLFSRKTTNSIQLLEWMKRILQYRTQFLRMHESEASQGSTCKISQQMYTMLETVLLLFLRNTNIESVRVAMSCFRYLCLEAELVASPTEPSCIPYAHNLRAYRQLEEASKALLTGRQAQQRKIRAIFRELVHSPGSALAWEDTYSSWRVSKALLISYQREDVAPPDLLRFTTESIPRNFMKRVNTFAHVGKEQQLTEENLQATLLNWTNMTGFLCSLAGVSTKPSSGVFPLIPNINIIDPPADHHLPPVAQPSPKETPSAISALKRRRSYHDRPKSVASIQVCATPRATDQPTSGPPRLSGMDHLEEVSHHSRTSQTETFISELMHLLNIENVVIGVNIRETVKELVSYELSPPVYPYLFQCMLRESQKVFSHEGPGARLVISESNTTLIDQLVSIVQHVLETKVEGAVEHLLHIRLEDTLTNLVMYANGLDMSERSLPVRIKVSHLIATVVNRSRDLSFRQEVHLRNQLVEHLSTWVSGEVCIGENLSHKENLINELDLCAMRAIGLTLNGLVLQPKDMTGDIFEEKGRLFQKYFTNFMQLIHSLNHIDWSTLSQIQRQSLQRHVTSLREATIQAMSNMLTANIDSGLTHALKLGYHEDLQTRTSFIEVLTSILKQGAEFNSLADTALADRFNSMLELVTTEGTDQDFPILMALISAVPPENVDDLAEVLVVLFDYKNKLAPFLERVFVTEVEALESGRVDTLFRGNSIACKVLSLSFKTFGLYYLQSVVRPLILQLMKSNDRDYEVDPTRLSDPSNLERNQAHLLELVQCFYTTILNSLPSLPLQLRTVCHMLYSVVTRPFPDSGLDTVNSAIFLRFINPAIISPQSYNLITGDIPISVQRGLTFISKVLQNLANHVLFKKEQHMEVFNKFLMANFDHSRELALLMASMGPYTEGEAGEYIAFLKEAYKHRLHSLLWTNQEKVVSYAASTRTCVSSRHLFHQLNTLLAQMGAPNYRRKRTSTTRSALVSSQLEEFLDSMANECDEKTLRSIKAKEVFYQGGVSRAGNPVFYFIVRKFRGDQLQVSYQLLYHMMTLLRSGTEKAMEMVVDLSQAGTNNEPDLELLVKFAAYLPELAMSQIEAIYFYNPNTAFRNYASKLAAAIRIFSHIQGAKRVLMIDTLSRFSEFIDPSERKLPSSTLAFEEEGKVDFGGLHYILFKQRAMWQLPAALQVCSCGLVVTLTDRVKVFECPTTIKEIYHISSIREVFSECKGSLTVRLVEGNQVLKFNTAAADAVVQAAGIVISKWQNQQPSRYMSERKLEPKDLPGTFLNLALINLGCPDSVLRLAAFKLLSAVKSTFHLRIDRHLESCHDLCIPMNTAHYVTAISEELARNEPHLTLEFLSEVVAGFQQYTPALKQLCLSYMSPWIPNLSRFASRTEGVSEHEKLMNLIDLLVALTISEDAMYPLIQVHVWLRIGNEPAMLKRVLDAFIRMGISDGLGSRKLETLADTTVTLAQVPGTMGSVASEIIRRMLKTMAHTSDRVTHSLEKHFLWSELTVLSRFLLALSFNNKISIVNYLADVIYLCVLMMAYGPVFVRATIHGILINITQSLACLPQVMSSEHAVQHVSLKLVEFSDPKFYMQFGIQHPASLTAFQWAGQSSAHHQGADSGKDALSATSVVMVTEHLLDMINTCAPLMPESGWLMRWQKLVKRTSFYYNPSLQSRSFLMLGVISDKVSLSLVTRTLRSMEETLEKHEDDVTLLEAIIICLTRMVPLLDENTKLNQHLFWVSVGILQLGEAALFAAGLALMEACIKTLLASDSFEAKTLEEVMLPTREAMEWPLSQMDREVGISFGSDFNFALAGLLYKGFSHPLSTVRTRTQELLTTLFFMHSLERLVFEVNELNLAYVTALFPESEIVRSHLKVRRTRLMSIVPTFVPSSAVEGEEGPTSYSALLSPTTIPTHKLQVLMLLTLASALIQTQEEVKVLLLYEFLADACPVYGDVFPLIHVVLVEHMAQTMAQSQSTAIIKAVQTLVSAAVMRSGTAPLLKPSHIGDIGFGGLGRFFMPFPKHGLIYPTTQGALFQKYLEVLVQELSPAEGSAEKGSIILTGGKLSLSLSTITVSANPPPAPSLPRRSESQSARLIERTPSPDRHRFDVLLVLSDDEGIEETDL